MEHSKIVQVSDINRKRSSLKNPEDMRKILDFKSKNLQFDLDVIQETKEVRLNYLILVESRNHSSCGP